MTSLKVSMILLWLMCAFPHLIFAQDQCGFDQRLHDQIENNPDILKQFEQRETVIKKAFKKSRRLVQDKIVIPVVVHVLHLGEQVGIGTNISSAQIVSAISQLNKAFNGKAWYTGPESGIRFALAKRAPDCNMSNGIVRVNASQVCDGGDCYLSRGMTVANEYALKSLSYWPSEEYLNIWVVSEIDDNGAGSGIQGFAQFPDGSPETDGVVILYNAMGYDADGSLGYKLKESAKLAGILIHEVGHSLGLYHSFEGDDYDRNGTGERCPSFTGCGPFNGDCVDDTPPHIRSHGDCNTKGTNVCDGGFSNKRYVHNFMNYASEACQTEFTPGQISRMKAVLASQRLTWALSHGDLAPIVNTDMKVSCRPQTLIPDNNYNLGITHFRLGDFSMSSGSTDEDGGYLDQWCATAQVESNNSYPIYVATGDQNLQNVKVFIDYNSDGDFNDRDEVVFTSNQKMIHQGEITIPRHARKSQLIRVRVISAYPGFNISDACFTPYFGQVEDYSMIVDGMGPPEKVVELTGKFESDFVDVEWNVSTRDTERKYMLEGSTDGSSFSPLTGAIEASGNTMKFRDFSFEGKKYYRVKVLDNNDQLSYSEPLQMSRNISGDVTLLPNPASQSVRVQTSSNLSEWDRIQVLDVNGKMLRSIDVVDLGGRADLDIGDLRPGIYYIRMIGKDLTKTSKLTKV